MVAVDYSEYFWGEKHHGYHILYNNLKSGEDSVQELAQFFKDRLVYEEENIKFLSKSISRAAALQSADNALHDISWGVTRNTLVILAEIQTSFLHSLQKLLKDVTRYHEDLIKSRKRVKEQDVIDAVNLMQTTTTCLQKSKETYLQRCAELEKLKKENATSKEIVKAESKVLRSREEYRNYVDKYANVRNEFEDKMLKASRSFQAHDKAFLQQFKLFLLSFAEAMDERVSASSQVYAQYKESIENIDIDDLMRRFVEKKGTGKDRPEHIVFEEIDTVGGDVSATATTSGPSSSNSSAIMHPLTQAEPVPPSANDLLTIEAEAHENQENHWNGTARNTQPSSPILSDSGSSPPVTPVPPTQPSFSASLGRQKLAAWLPGKRKKRASQCSLPAGDIPVNEPHGSTENTGFLKKYRSKTKKSMTDLTSASERQSHSAVDDCRSTASSSKSDEKTNSWDVPTGQPSSASEVPVSKEIDNEGFCIPKNRAEPLADSSRWSSCTDSSSEDDKEVARAAKIRQISIQPLNESRTEMNASVDELRDAIDNINLSASLRRSSTFDNDPWSIKSHPPPFSMSLGGNIQSLKARYESVGNTRRFLDSRSQMALPFSASLSAGSTVRARPRSNTPTFVSSCMSLSASYSTPPVINGRCSTDREVARADSLCSLNGAGCIDIIRDMTSPTLFLSHTAGSGDRIPIAMAINEHVHAWFKGSDISQASVRVFGSLLISFPVSCFSALTDLDNQIEPLKFHLNSTDKIKTVLLNKKLLIDSSDALGVPYTYSFKRRDLAECINKQKRDKPSTQFFNAELLRYELDNPLAPPLLMTTYWKVDDDNTDLRIDYRLNTDSAVQNALLNISFKTKISGGVIGIIADPKEYWSPQDTMLTWSLTELSRHGDCSGSLKARISLSRGPSVPSQTCAQFEASDSSISGVGVSVESLETYNLSLVRRKVLSGKYYCDPEIRM